MLAFDVQYWNGSSWVTIPGGSVTGNNKVWRKFTFSAITTNKIRVYINSVPDAWSRVVEIQAFGTSAGGEKVQWLVPDHLGTPRIIIDETGNRANVKHHDYLPFGEELFAGTGGRTAAFGYTGDGVRQQFTSKERDAETGLDYFEARYYASVQRLCYLCYRDGWRKDRVGWVTWRERDINSRAGISEIFFLDSEHGWAVGYGTILSTTDSGRTWAVTSSGEWKPLSAVFFANRHLGWIAAGSVILRTSDGGKTWTETSAPAQGQLAGLSFIDAQHGWVAKSRGEEGSVVHIPGKDILTSESSVLSTTDGGQTWQTVSHIKSRVDHGAWILNVFFINRTDGWAVGRDGLIMRTVDAGKNWQRRQLTLTAGSLRTK